MMEFAGGVPPASPTPTPIRAREEMPVITCQPARRCKCGPGDQRGDKYVPPVTTVGKPGHGNAKGNVEQAQWHAGKKTDASIGELQLQPDGLKDGRDHIAVSDVDRVHEAHDDDNVPAFCKGRRLRLGGIRHG